MFVDAIANLLHDYSCFLFLLSVAGLLCFSAGLCAPRKRRAQLQHHEAGKALNWQREADGSHYTAPRAGDSNIEGREVNRRSSSKRQTQETPSGEREAFTGSMSANEVREIRTAVVKQESKLRADQGLKKVRLESSSSSSPRPHWLRSLSRGGAAQHQRKEKTGSVGGHGEQKKKGSGGVERKGSLTGEEVKEMADAFIERMRQRLRLQRQESYEARLDRSS
ncbi:hypothetical protein L7F22_030772 [Adiantum nelumboides]|nr:hypothetical protein [Adiantum nelumboides]